MDVLTCGVFDMHSLRTLLARFGLRVTEIAAGQNIPGSFWGDSEAGLVGDALLVRADTPVHSALHEACHYICMDPTRRSALHTNAGGDTNEENGVCYLQILLAGHLPALGRARLWSDMDTWGYSFRLGSAQAWFEHDADDARDWLVAHDILDSTGALTWCVRQR
ncbi:MAG: hypothetical protein HY273_03505 [Gammaproteobacteria bacterium]|nr:hypothetical protein [Gammaproteobacteria bacterium]